MPTTPDIAGKITFEYLEKYGDSMMKMTLARLMYKENPEVFASVDDARFRIRYYTGSAGDKNRRKMTELRFINACQPQSQMTVREDFILPRVNNNCLLLPDVHVPYHDVHAVDAALKFGIDKGVNTVIIAGDFMDFYNLSKFQKDPRERDLRYELDSGYEMMLYIANRLPNAKIYFLPGNHEIRLESYLRLKAPELLGAEPGLCDLDFYLKFSDFGATYLRNSQVIQAGKLFIGHGHEFRGGSGGVNPARTFFLRTYSNFIGGHFHQTSEQTNTRLDGSIDACWSMGCLCGLTPDYMPYNKWNHGFAHLRTQEDGSFKVFNARIYNGKVL